MNKKEKLEKKIKILNEMLKNEGRYVETMKKEQEKEQEILNAYLKKNETKKI